MQYVIAVRFPTSLPFPSYLPTLLSSARFNPFPRRTWLSRCVFRGCVGAGVMQHAYHLAQILRAQATRFLSKRVRFAARTQGACSQRRCGESHRAKFESVIGKPQHTSSWSDSEAVFRVAVCVGVLRNSNVNPWALTSERQLNGAHSSISSSRL